MSTYVRDLLPASLRRKLYITFAFIGVGFGATQTAFLTAESTAPLWLTVAFQVYLYVGGAFGLLAATNTGTPSANEYYDVGIEDNSGNTPKHADV